MGDDNVCPGWRALAMNFSRKYFSQQSVQLTHLSSHRMYQWYCLLYIHAVRFCFSSALSLQVHLANHGPNLKDRWVPLCNPFEDVKYTAAAIGVSGNNLLWTPLWPQPSKLDRNCLRPNAAPRCSGHPRRAALKSHTATKVASGYQF